jgi:hypothetical protein
MLAWRIRWAPNNASRWQVGFNSAFKGLSYCAFLINRTVILRRLRVLLSLSVLLWHKHAGWRTLCRNDSLISSKCHAMKCVKSGGVTPIVTQNECESGQLQGVAILSPWKEPTIFVGKVTGKFTRLLRSHCSPTSSARYSRFSTQR